MAKISFLAIPLLCCALTLAPCLHASAVRNVVVYQSGVLDSEDTSSSSTEEIPPREEWFRVRASQNRPKAVSLGTRETVVLPTGMPTSRSTSASDQQISVFTHSRGKSGFLNNNSAIRRQEHDINIDRENRPLSPPGRTQDDIVDLSTKLPSGARQENWYQYARQQHRTIPSRTAILGNGYETENWGNKQSTSPTTDEQNLEAETDVQYDNDLPVVSYDDPVPPPHEKTAKMARYIVRSSNWTSVATISTLTPVQGFPFVNVFSVSDGPSSNSSGIPFMYVTPLDMSMNDLQNDSRASMTMTLAQSNYCEDMQYDPEDPRCAKVILSGKIVKVTDPEELIFARNALFSRHPEMQDWPKDHGWYFAKLNLAHILVLDYFGGAKTVSLPDYFQQ